MGMEWAALGPGDGAVQVFVAGVSGEGTVGGGEAEEVPAGWVEDFVGATGHDVLKL